MPMDSDSDGDRAVYLTWCKQLEYQRQVAQKAPRSPDACAHASNLKLQKVLQFGRKKWEEC